MVSGWYVSTSNSNVSVPTGKVKVMFIPYRDSVNNEYKVEPGKYKVHLAYGSETANVFLPVGTFYKTLDNSNNYKFTSI